LIIAGSCSAGSGDSNEEFKVAHGQRVGFIRAEDHLVQVFEKLSAEEMLGLSVPELADRFGCSRPPSESPLSPIFWLLGCSFANGNALAQGDIPFAGS
jgi:hypothetical protein